ncbi:MAG: hypothetical protein K6F04_03610 [bacterium]|nr:hypothetical protein [bacterium]
MTTEEIIKKAREMGLSEDEISKFIENEAIAKKYGFEDEYASVNVKIDKKKQALMEAGASEEEVFAEDDDCDCHEDCECEECHCEDDDCDCHCHHHHD